jgi:alpha-beta hydrolase superfamily lysophospholipase
MTRLLALLSALVCLAACAPLVQTAGRPPVGFAGPRLERDRFISFDGTALGLSRWEAKGEPSAVIIGLHGMNDYGNGFWMAGPWWAERGVTTWAYDQRGFGRSPRRGIWGGEPLMTEDLRVICALARQAHPHAVIAVVGESMGGAVAVDAFASDHPPDADRVVLLAPAVWGWSNQPAINRIALWLGAHLMGGHSLEPPGFVTEHIQASDNLPELRRMGRDPLMIWGTRPDTVYGLMNLMEHANRKAGEVRAPMLYLYGAHDQLIPEDATLAAVARLKPAARTGYYPDGWHILLRDYEAKTVWDDILAYVKDPLAPLPSGVGPIPARPADIATHK